MAADEKTLNTASGPVPSNAPPPARGVKVALDIDDAPFLQEPEEEKPKEKPAEPAKPVSAPQPKAAKAASPSRLQALLDRLQARLPGKKKLIIIGGGLTFVLVVLPLILMLVLGKAKTPPPVAHEPVRILVPIESLREDPPPGPRFLYRLGGFFIERPGSEGELRFLRCSFAIPTDNPALFAELGAKELVVRNAIYYYLTHRSLSFLADNRSREILKSDLLAVINDLLSAENVQELLFEEYLVTGR